MRQRVKTLGVNMYKKYNVRISYRGKSMFFTLTSDRVGNNTRLNNKLKGLIYRFLETFNFGKVELGYLDILHQGRPVKEILWEFRGALIKEVEIEEE